MIKNGLTQILENPLLVKCNIMDIHITANVFNKCDCIF